MLHRSLLAAIGLLVSGAASAQTINPGVFAIMNQAADKTLAAPLTLQNFTWTAYAPPTILPPVATHICVVTGITGKLAGGGELLRLYIDAGAQGGARYMLGGQSGQSQLRITATCAAKSQFVTPGIGRTLNEEASDTLSRGGCASQNISVTPAIKPSAIYLGAIGGRFADAGESVNVTSGFLGMPVVKIAGCSGPVSAGVLAIGVAPTIAPVYRTKSGRSHNAAQSTFVRLTWSNWEDTTAHALGTLFTDTQYVYEGDTFLVPANDALCGLTGVTGKFNGYGETISVSPESENGQQWWKVQVGTGALANEPYLSASVRCYARDQRPL